MLNRIANAAKYHVHSIRAPDPRDGPLYKQLSEGYLHEAVALGWTLGIGAERVGEIFMRAVTGREQLDG